MGSIRSKIQWNERSEFIQSIIVVSMILGTSLGLYGLLMFSMGNTTPLVVVTSGSMEPNLYAGDLLLIQSQSEENIEIDDIIVFRDTVWSSDTTIVHRVVDIQVVNGTFFYTTKGDNNPSDDPGERTIDEIHGVVIGRIPYIGHISLIVREYWYIVIPILMGIILIVPEIWDRYKGNQ